MISTKKLKNGFEIPVLGLGTWKMGGLMEQDPTNNDEANITAIQTAIEMGVTHIDTAAMYAGGHAEELVGKAISGFDRSKLFIASKVWRTNLARQDIIKSAKESLKRLNTDYFDLFLIHGPNPEIPIEDTMHGMNDLIEMGFTKHIGVCNFTVERFKEAQQYAQKEKLVVNQVHYNLIFREPERKGLVQYCQENDVLLEAWRPIQYGTLAQSGIMILDEMCRKYNKTPVQIALNWLISQKNVVAITKMSSGKHIEENFGALGWEMEKEDIEKIRKEFPNQQDISDVAPMR